MKRFLNFPDGVSGSGGGSNSYKGFKINIDALAGSAYTTTGASAVYIPCKSQMNIAIALEFFNLTSDADMRRIANGINDAIIANPGGSIVDVKGYVLSNYEITNP